MVISEVAPVQTHDDGEGDDDDDDDDDYAGDG